MSTASSSGKPSRNRQRFLRHCMTTTGVFESICCQCGHRIAYGPEMRALQIAEECHICPSQQASAEEPGVIG